MCGEITWQLTWLLLPAGAMALVGYGDRGLWAGMTGDERRFAVRFSSLMLGALFDGSKPGGANCVVGRQAVAGQIGHCGRKFRDSRDFGVHYPR
jgi:hypothetical protein